jgi:hypothetical protein
MALHPEDAFLAALVDEVDEQYLAEQCSARLSLGPAVEGERLSTGRSRSLVLAALVTSGPVVMKVTTDPARIARAELEARLLTDSGGQFAHVMPRLVASERGHGWVAIATQKSVPLAPPQQLNHEEWVALAAALATLQQPPKPAVVGLHATTRSARTSNSDRGLKVWAKLGSGRDAARGVELLKCTPSLDLPLVLEHGDCHTENLVQHPAGGYRWIDWQEAHLGDGLSDLVFMWQRAEFAGARPPRPEMTAVYAHARQLAPSKLQPLLDHAELRLLLHSWPPFLGYGGPAAQDVMRRRLNTLVSR